MGRLLLRWWYRPAAWWQFWLPQSGPLGGLFGGLLLWSPLAALLR